MVFFITRWEGYVWAIKQRMPKTRRNPNGGPKKQSLILPAKKTGLASKKKRQRETPERGQKEGGRKFRRREGVKKAWHHVGRGDARGEKSQVAAIGPRKSGGASKDTRGKESWKAKSQSA